MQQDRIIFSISQLNAEVGQLLNQAFPALWVEGEISNYLKHTSGHLYFSLKDEGTQVKCAMFRHHAMKLRLTPKNGMKVIVRGRVGLYEPRGDFQFVIEQLEDAGQGALQRQFEALKQSLQAQGLFDSDHKQVIPAFPKNIGVITSPTGAAIRDILNVLKRRCPQVPVWIYPVAVQGEGSKEQIVKALQQASQDKRCDILILARGGGSIEDLWSFNEEAVARAIYDCPIPIVTGIGHEIDFTIADFVADQRAPTPSAAAELVSPDTQPLLAQLQRLRIQLMNAQMRYQDRWEERLQRLQHRLSLQQPSQRLQQKSQRLDELDMRLHTAILGQMQKKTLQLGTLHKHVEAYSPYKHIQQQTQQLQGWYHTLNLLMQKQLKKIQSQLRLEVGRLQALSPLATLERGYGIVKTSDYQRVIRSVQQVTVGQVINLQLKDGELQTTVTAVTYK